MAPPPQRTDRLLELLLDEQVQFVVVGGVAAVAHGGTTVTTDLDIVVAMTAENLDRLMTALAPFHPRHVTRRDLGVITQPGEELASFRLLLIETDLGRLDVLSELEPIGPIGALDVEYLELLEGRRFPVLSLEQLITVKQHLGRPKDLLVAAELRAIRALQGPNTDDE
ncbi:MAG: hypothetical protein JW797_01615 [Bradymonadales bacterium]|nr:hypothetical protein [Bradymonadales bacterium]